MYHSINITESLLFEKDGDHYKIASAYLPNLRFLNLLVIDFTNVDIRYVDFRGTNAIIDPQKIYNKDASYAKFDEYNLRAFANYKEVNLTGSELDIIPTEQEVVEDDSVLTNITPFMNKETANLGEPIIDDPIDLDEPKMEDKATMKNVFIPQVNTESLDNERLTFLAWFSLN